MTRFDSRPSAVQALLEQAADHLRHDRFADARPLLDEALARAVAAGDRSLEALATHRLGTCDLSAERWSDAIGRFERALALRQGIGDRAGEAASLSQLGLVRLYQRDFAAARRLFDAALALDLTLGDRRGAAMTRAHLAAAAMEEGDHAGAARGFHEATATMLTLGDWHGAAGAIANAASLARRMNRARGALRLHLLSAMMKTSLKHSDAHESVEAANRLAGELCLSDLQMESDFHAVQGAFERDRGLSVLEESLGLEPASPADAPAGA